MSIVKNIGIGKEAIRKAITTRLNNETVDKPLEIVLNSLDTETCQSLFGSLFKPLFHAAYFTIRRFSDYNINFRVSRGYIMMNICHKDEDDLVRLNTWRYTFEFDENIPKLTDHVADEFIDFLLIAFNDYINEPY